MPNASQRDQNNAQSLASLIEEGSSNTNDGRLQMEQKKDGNREQKQSYQRTDNKKKIAAVAVAHATHAEQEPELVARTPPKEEM